MYTKTLFLVTLTWIAVAYASGSGKERSSLLLNADVDDLDRRLIQKRAGARSFGPRMYDFESYLYPTSKRFGSFPPYYFYQQPKRGGGRSFASYWNPPSETGRFYEDSPFFKKRSYYPGDDYLF
ncbi:hypothetical protein Tcan_10979 [Toxocara canis]|uniref:Uncharacterized protein n=1 Tax=Toxocara canis TaxID=6265 RepID=A0A0B2UZG2_TOXCA|nr:hypothetical protein Tcan_10979 [Toxocara canis]